MYASSETEGAAPLLFISSSSNWIFRPGLLEFIAACCAGGAVQSAGNLGKTDVAAAWLHDAHKGSL